MTKRLFLSIIYAGCILAFIGGCAPTTTQQSAVPRMTSGAQTQESDPSLLRQAERTADRALMPGVTTRDSLLLDAALLFAQGGDVTQSLETLQLINPDNLSDDFYSEYILLGIELDLATHQPAAAHQRLKQPRFNAARNNLSANFSQRLLSLESDLYYAEGNVEQSIAQSVALAELFSLTKPTEQKSIALIHNKIWRQLNELPFYKLQKAKLGAKDVLSGWRELAVTMRYQQGDRMAQERLFNVWKQRWPQHPAAIVTPSALKRKARDTTVETVALLLPLQNEYAIPSETLLNGFMSAYYESMARGSAVPHVDILDTSSRPIEDVYNSAIERGAQRVIGPMRQSQVEELLLLPTLSVPTITLNRIDKALDNPPANLFQFGLSALDEVEQIADRAWQQGKINALIISPNNGWGERASAHFVRYWQDKGGVITNAVSYGQSANDFTSLLKAPLEIDLSEQRGLELRRYVNRNLSYTPRRRQDIDFVVVLGYSEKVRQIKPALDFLYAGDLPVYATSHIYSGTQEAELNRDLANIEFSAMPWSMEGYMAKKLTPDQRLPTAYRQLYALGYDAFMLHGMLEELSRPNTVPLFGSTGLLTISAGVIKRKGQWAVFSNGQAKPIQP